MDKMKKKGVFLTLGITFVSIAVLSLASLVLRNSEYSEDRIMELAAIDRIYSIDRSLGFVYRDILFDVLKFNLTINESYIKMDKFVTNVTVDSDIDRAVIDGLFSLLYANSIFKDFGYSATSLTQEYSKFYFDYPYTDIIYYQARNNTASLAGFEVTGSNIIVASVHPFIARNFTVIIKHNSVNGSLNWSIFTDPSVCPPQLAPVGCVHTLNVTFLGPGGWVNSTQRMIGLIPLNGSNETLAQRIDIFGLESNPAKIPFVGLTTLVGGLIEGTSFGAVNYAQNFTVTLIADYFPSYKNKLGLYSEIVSIPIPNAGIRRYGRIRVL